MKAMRWVGFRGLLLLLGAGVWAEVHNGGFDEGLRGWKASWNMEAVSGEAVFDDARTDQAFLFQSVATGGVIRVVFDFYNGLSSDVPQGAFRDSFFASVYGVDDPARYIHENDVFDYSHGLMDLDAGGAFNVNGAVGASPKGAGWQRFAGSVTNAHAHLAVVFEFHDLNTIAGDSAVRIDNVAVQAAP